MGEKDAFEERCLEEWYRKEKYGGYLNYHERATLARAKRVDIHSILVLGPSALGKGENYLWEWKFRELTLRKFENLTISYSESASSITPVEPLKPRFYTILKFVYFLVVNNNKYSVHVVDNIIFGISIPDYPSRTVETTFLAQFLSLSTF